MTMQELLSLAQYTSVSCNIPFYLVPNYKHSKGYILHRTERLLYPFLIKQYSLKQHCELVTDLEEFVHHEVWKSYIIMWSTLQYIVLGFVGSGLLHDFGDILDGVRVCNLYTVLCGKFVK